MSTENVDYEVIGRAAVIRLNRPAKLNAFTRAMIFEILESLDRAAADQRVFGIVITGVGPAFCAGLDIGDLMDATSVGAAGGRQEPPVIRGALPALFSSLFRLPKPIIAAVNGVAAAGGFVLAMMCDLRFAAEEAGFTTVFSRRGLIAEHGMSWILPRLIGTSRALDLLWSSRRIDSSEAYRIGLVDRVVSGAQLLNATIAYVSDLAASTSPRAIQTMKAQVYGDLSNTFERATVEAHDRTWEAIGWPDAAEGARAFLEHRSPRFPELKS